MGKSSSGMFDVVVQLIMPWARPCRLTKCRCEELRGLIELAFGHDHPSACPQSHVLGSSTIARVYGTVWWCTIHQ